MAKEKVTRMRVYFQKDFSRGIQPGDHMSLTKKDITDEITHRFVKEVFATNLEDAFMKMQGYVWSPNGEARELIRSLDLHHTSLSVGDVVETKDGSFWFCSSYGWDQIR